MLSMQCRGCGKGTPLDRFHAWAGGSPACSAECLAKLEASAPRTPAVDALRASALAALARVRRESANVAALETLVLDRSQAAGKIIGLTRASRRRRDRYLREAQELGGREESARFEVEQALIAVVSAAMALRETAPDAVGLAVTFAAEFPSSTTRLATDPRLDEFAAAIAGPAPARLVVDTVAAERRRIERHVDALVGWKAVDLYDTSGRVHTLEAVAPWAKIRQAELKDGLLAVKLGGDDPTPSYDVPKNDEVTIWGWLKAERSDLAESERPMTAGEALSSPGCVAIVALGVVGFGAVGLESRIPELFAWACMGLGALFVLGALGWGASRILTRPIVKELGVKEPLKLRSPQRR